MKLTISSVSVYNVIPFTFDRADMSEMEKGDALIIFFPAFSDSTFSI